MELTIKTKPLFCEREKTLQSKTLPKILIVTPEVNYLPDQMGSPSTCLTAKAGGLADVSATLIYELFRKGANIHVAIPDYRAIYGNCSASLPKEKLADSRPVLPEDQLHLAKDQAFFYRQSVYSGNGDDNMKLSLAFQREVINNIVPRVKPDLIHCNDWMTGLLPAMARKKGIPCLFTIHNIHSIKTNLATIEDRGIDAQHFWEHLYFERYPDSYEGSRNSNAIELLTSGVFAAHFVNTVSPNFLREIITGQHDFVSLPLLHELTNKWNSGCAFGILNAPNPSFDPTNDADLFIQYCPKDHQTAKRKNKLALQKRLGLIEDEDAPLFFWPSRLDPLQKGCQLLAEITYKVISQYWDQKLTIVFVADGPYQQVFKDIATYHGLQERIAVCKFDDHLEHFAYAAADFILMPSRFEPCGLPQMIGPIYGALPIAHDTGGIHDTVVHLDVSQNFGNGFLFKTYDSNGLLWAIDQAMHFYAMPVNVKQMQVERIMRQSAESFNYKVTAEEYIKLYEKMLIKPVVI